MIDKFTILLAVIAIFASAVWMTAAPMAGRQAQSDWLKKRLNAHRRFVSAQVMDELGSTRSDYATADQNAIRRLYEQCGSY